MIAAIVLMTLRECLRRPLPYLAVAAPVALTFAAQILHISAFDAGATEATNLAISAVLLSGLAFTALVGTSLVRLDLERGTLALLRSQPPTLECYVVARFLGLAAATLFVCALAAAGAAASLALAGAPDGALSSPLFLGWTRVALAMAVLSAAALAVSAATSRIFAPVLLLALFLAADIAPSATATRVAPNFVLFGLDAGRAPSLAWLSLYATLYSVVFLIAAYLQLTLRAPARTIS
jgi:hypothetical protein